MKILSIFLVLVLSLKSKMKNHSAGIIQPRNFSTLISKTKFQFLNQIYNVQNVHTYGTGFSVTHVKNYSSSTFSYTE